MNKIAWTYPESLRSNDRYGFFKKILLDKMKIMMYNNCMFKCDDEEE